MAEQQADLEIIITFGGNSWELASGVSLIDALFNPMITEMTNEIWTSRVLLFTINDTCIKCDNLKPKLKGDFFAKRKKILQSFICRCAELLDNFLDRRSDFLLPHCFPHQYLWIGRRDEFRGFCHFRISFD
jgi:hypothetical protein